MIIEWKGKIGYGDIVSPLCYAQNQSEITGKLVNLQFYWPHEHLDYIAQNKATCKKLVDLIDLRHVVVDHIDDSYLPYNHTNYDAVPCRENDVYHNIYFPKIDIDPKYTVVCSPIGNKQPLMDYSKGKAWKDGLGFLQWLELERNAIVVNYKTPFDELVDILSNCRYYIGYHGSVSWMARLFGLPMTIHSHDARFTQWAFPWQAKTMEESQILLEQCKVKREQYIDNLRRT
jgi:hypothetical protein